MPDYITITESGFPGISTIATSLSTTSVAVAVGFIGATGPIGSGFSLSGPDNGLITRNGLEGNVAVAEAGFTYDPNGTGYLSGKFGINTNNPTFTLDVVGSGNFSSGVYSIGNIVVTGSVVRPTETGVFATATNLASTGSTLTTSISNLSGTLTGGYVRLNESRPIVTSSSVSIGTATSTALLTVGASGSTTAASGLTFANDALANLYRSAVSTIKTDGNFLAMGTVGIGANTPTQKLDISGGNIQLGNTYGIFSRLTNGTVVGILSYNSSNLTRVGANGEIELGGYLAFKPSGVERVRIIPDGNVGIGTTTPAALLTVGPGSSTTAASGLCFGNESSSNLYRSATSTIKTDSNLIVAQNLTVTNHLSAATKSFLIDHPIKIGKKLQYGVLEGPEHSVYIRGKMSNSNFINFPDYWNYLVDLNSITASITPIGNSQNLFVQEINCSGVIVAGEALEKMNYYYHVFGERKDVPKIQIEI